MLAVDGDRLLAERGASADAAVEALPGLGRLEVGRELDRAGAAGDGDTGLLELDADVLRGMTDERRRRVGRAERFGQKGGLRVGAGREVRPLRAGRSWRSE